MKRWLLLLLLAPAAGMICLINGLGPLFSGIETSGVLLGIYMMLAGGFRIRDDLNAPASENRMKDPLVRDSMSLLFGLVILALCIYAPAAALLTIK